MPTARSLALGVDGRVWRLETYTKGFEGGDDIPLLVRRLTRDAVGTWSMHAIFARIYGKMQAIGEGKDGMH